ncbi:MAG: hypothetical protein CMA12_08560 [Euryarchaeota archaeon]|nr:hypothetical protein [Euryarchaeota archaeon]
MFSFYKKTLSLRLIYVASIYFVIYYFWDFFTLYPMGFIADDSYFYSQIAYNIGVNKFSSWDGINLTSSYHLLWVLVISVTSLFLSFFTDIKGHHLIGHIFVYISIILFLLAYYTDTILEKFIVFSIIISGYILMENITVIFLLFIIFKEIQKYVVSKQNSYLLLLAFFLIPLSRIDAIALVGFIPLLYFIKTKDKFFFYLLICLSLGLIFNFLIYYLIAGEIYSVSSYVKMNQNITNTMEHRIVKNALYSNLVPLGWFTLKLRAYVLITLFIIIIFSITVKKQKQSILFYGLFLGLYSYFFIQLFLNYIDTWYYSVMFGSLFLIFKVLKLQTFWRLTSISIFYILVSLLFLGKFYNSYKFFDYRVKYINEVQNIEKYIPEDSKIYQYDLAGHLGFYSQIKVINGDGRVNSFKYAKNLLNKNLSNYLISNKICYLTDIFTQQLGTEKVILNQSNLIVKYSDVNLIKKFENFNLYKLSNCKNN